MAKSKRKSPLSRIPYVLLGFFGAWAANILTQAIMSGDIIRDPVAMVQSAMAAHPETCGVETTGVPFIVLVAVALIAFFEAFSDNGKLEPDAVRAMEAHGKARFAERSELEQFAHIGTKVKVQEEKKIGPFKYKATVTKAWPKPDLCESIEDDNFIMGKTSRISLGKNPNISFERNKHVFVEAGSGAGKTFNFIGNNIMQLNSSYVFTDPKGEILEQYGEFFRKNGYRVVVVNIKDEDGFRYSNRYNPLWYARNSTSLADIVELLIKNTSNDSKGGSDSEFYRKAEQQLYLALMGYLYFMYHDVAPEYCTIPEMLDMLALAKSEDGKPSQLDMLFFATAKENGFSGYKERTINRYGSEKKAMESDEWFPITEYEGFKAAAGSAETTSNILISCLVRLAPFAIAPVKAMFTTDELDLARVGTEKTALFIITSSQKGTYDFIASMVLYQLFDQLTQTGDSLPGRRLPLPVCCYLDEVANIGAIPGLAKNLAFIRSYGVNLILITQSKDDLERAYSKEDVGSILNNCDAYLYLGRDGMETCERLSKEIGNRTVAYETKSTNKDGMKTSYNTSVQYTQVPLLPADEIANALDGNECLVHFKQAYWYRDFKADPREHKRWAELQAAGRFDITKLRSNSGTERKKQEVNVASLASGGRIVANFDLSEFCDTG